MGRSITKEADSYGYWPILGARTAFGAAAFAAPFQSNRGEGFAGDGDYIDLPISAATNIEYFNSAGTSQWTVAKTDLHANVDVWGGFLFSGGDALIYTVGVDTGTTPDTIYTASINSAGTVTLIGSAQFTNDFPTTSGGHSISPITTGATVLYRDTEDSGNLFLRQTEVAGCWGAEIDISTGAVVSQPTLISAGLLDCAYRTAAGNYSSGPYHFAAPDGRFVYGPIDATILAGMGIESSATTKFTQWKGSVYYRQVASAGAVPASASWPTATFEAWVDAIVLKGGGG